MSGITIERYGVPVLHMGRIPGRKRQAVSFIDGNIYEPVAYFTDDGGAERFKTMLRTLINEAAADTEDPRGDDET